ncbi:hypothetical protein CLOM_g22191 [Closterium sp. NIES-68]|nr:hypothetical protein CLOM_g22191 [Closterium sp. NIES-68]GJP86233.1 hypothetical protein CLOP_g16282 [Closterium sp. NIES-67]
MASRNSPALRGFTSRSIDHEFWNEFSVADGTWLYVPLTSCSVDHEFWKDFSEEACTWLSGPLCFSSAQDSSIEHAFWEDYSEEECTWLYAPWIPFSEPVVTLTLCAAPAAVNTALSSTSTTGCSSSSASIASSSSSSGSSSASSMISSSETSSSNSSECISSSSSRRANSAGTSMSARRKQWVQTVAFRVGRFNEEDECKPRSPRASLGFSPLRPKAVAKPASKKPRPRDVMASAAAVRSRAVQSGQATAAAAAVKATPAKAAPAMATPGKATPAKATPSKATPTIATRAKAAGKDGTAKAAAVVKAAGAKGGAGKRAAAKAAPAAGVTAEPISSGKVAAKGVPTFHPQHFTHLFSVFSVKFPQSTFMLPFTERSLLQKQLTASLTITASAIGAGRRREQDVLLLPGLQVGSWLISFLNSLLFAPVTVEVEFLWRFCNALFG